MKRWTDYCSGLYNYQLHPDTTILEDVRVPGKEEESPSVIKKRWDRQSSD